MTIQIRAGFPRILLSLSSLAVCAGLISCAQPVTYREIVSEYATMKVAIPEPIPVEMRAMDSLDCNGLICTMTEDDFRASEADKQALARVKQAVELENQSRVRAYNSLLLALSHEDMARQKESERAENLERALDKERTANALQKWLERALFLMGVYVMGTL